MTTVSVAVLLSGSAKAVLMTGQLPPLAGRSLGG
jgi:hypothetical protein